MNHIKRFKNIACCLFLITGQAVAQIDTKELNIDGLKVIFKKNTKEVITASLFIKGGTANIKEAQQGIEPLSLKLALTGGTKTISKDDFAAKSDKLGALFSASSSKDYSQASMTCLKGNVTASWALFSDALFSPAMDANEFTILKDQMIAQAKQEEASPDAYLNNMAIVQTFGGSDYAKKSNGTPATLEALKLEDVKNYYKTLLGKKRCYLVVVGNLDEMELVKYVKTSFSKLPQGQAPLVPTFTSVEKKNIVIENRDLATNYIMGTLNAPKYISADGPIFDVAMSILSNRYFLELRSKRSLSYAPYTYYNKSTIQRPTSVVYISTIDPKQSLQVMTDIVNDVKKNGFTEREVKDKKKGFLTYYYMDSEGSASQANELGFCEASGDWRMFDQLNSKISPLNAKEVNDVFLKYINTIQWSYLGKENKVTEEDFKQLTK